MSKLRIAHLFLALLVISAPYFDVLSPEMADRLRHAAPHSAGSIGVNVFWLQILWAVKRTGGFLASLSSRAFDKVLEFFVNRVERLRIRRAEAERMQSAAASQALPLTEDDPHSADVNVAEPEAEVPHQDDAGLPEDSTDTFTSDVGVE
ncbi:hypothetical protein [Streptomyces sp. NPDC058475]|uniref:hypothetical protein n=1 Tax=Streptomyces sp. NPDC058475 TaxID=3346518 RepID=UPI00365EBE91